MYRNVVKRLLDIVLALAGLLVLAVPMLVIAVVVKVDSPGPVLFWQRRVGIHGTCFMMPKYRTMRMDTPHDVPTHLLRDPERWITRSGRVLRRYSLDELPQIFCILTAKMSVIGPRPALWNQGDLLAEREKYGANDIRPGLSGWAQINGRDELPVAVKARYDGEYVERMSFWFDCRCFFGTVWRVLRHNGVMEGGTGGTEPQEKMVEK